MPILTGLKGEPLEFTLLPWVGIVPHEPGVLVLAKGSARSAQPIVIEAARSLRNEFHTQRVAAIREGASLPLVRIEPNHERRVAIRADLLAGYQLRPVV